jgi:hypothetical protein
VYESFAKIMAIPVHIKFCGTVKIFQSTGIDRQMYQRYTKIGTGGFFLLYFYCTTCIREYFVYSGGILEGTMKSPLVDPSRLGTL